MSRVQVTSRPHLTSQVQRAHASVGLLMVAWRLLISSPAVYTVHSHPADHSENLSSHGGNMVFNMHKLLNFNCDLFFFIPFPLAHIEIVYARIAFSRTYSDVL